MNFTIKRNDSRSAIKATMLDAKGVPVNLTGASVRFILVKQDRSPKLARVAEITNPEGGQTRFVFNTAETNETGIFTGEFEVTYPDGGVETFPNTGYIKVLILSDLG